MKNWGLALLFTALILAWPLKNFMDQAMRVSHITSDPLASTQILSQNLDDHFTPVPPKAIEKPAPPPVHHVQKVFVPKSSSGLPSSSAAVIHNPPPFQLDAIFFGGHPVALLKGPGSESQLTKIGESYQGWHVNLIEKTRIEVEKDGYKVELHN